jgi:hypothetical protein
VYHLGAGFAFRIIPEARNCDRTRIIVKHDMRMKGLQISDVKTLLILLSDLIWIKGEDMEVISYGFLKGIINA